MTNHQKDLDGALVDFSKAIEINPRLAMAYNNRGRVRLDKGDFKRAVADFDKAIEINPQLALAYANRGLAWLAQGEKAEAQKNFDRCVTLQAFLKPLLDQQIKEVEQRLTGKE